MICLRWKFRERHEEERGNLLENGFPVVLINRFAWETGMLLLLLPPPTTKKKKMAIRSLLGKFGCCIYAVWGTATSFASPGVSLSLSPSLYNRLSESIEICSFADARVAFACSCNDESNVPLTPAVSLGNNNHNVGPLHSIGGEGFPAFLSRWESPTHTRKEKNEMMSRKRKEERILLYIFRNDNRAQPWSGQMMDRPASSHSALARCNRLFSQPKWRERNFTKIKNLKNKRDERLVKNRPKGWLVGWCATVEGCRIRPTFHIITAVWASTQALVQEQKKRHERWWWAR